MIAFADLSAEGVEVAGVQSLLFAQRHPEAAAVYVWFAERSAAELDRREGLEVSDRLRVPMPLVDDATRDRVLRTLDSVVGCEAARHAGLLPERADLSEGERYLRREVVNAFATLQATLARQTWEVQH